MGIFRRQFEGEDYSPPTLSTATTGQELGKLVREAKKVGINDAEAEVHLRCFIKAIAASDYFITQTNMLLDIKCNLFNIE